MNHEKAVSMTEDEIIDRKISENSKKTYKSAVKGFIRLLTEEERADYVGPDDLLTKSLEKRVVGRILNQSQIKVVNGRREKKTTSSFGIATSAMKYWHNYSNRFRAEGSAVIEISPEIRVFMQELTQGTKNVWADLKAAGEVANMEGKLPITFEGYKSLCRSALLKSASGNESILVHSFIVLCWNLSARASAVGSILWNNIGWDGDCLTVLYEKGKTNQDGSRKVPRHVFANPAEPLICPILALGLKICCESFVSHNTLRVFPSDAPEKAFSRWMTKKSNGFSAQVVGDDEDDENGDLVNFSTHSLRKGAATYMCGLTDGPDSDIVKLRMEHSLGRTDDKYIFREAGADKKAGRTVVGLNINDVSFSALPPHFKSIDFNVEEVIPRSTVERANGSLKRAFPFLVASVIYHWDWLTENLPKHHSFFASILYLKNYREKWGHLVVAGMFQNEESGLRASGIPGYVKNLFDLRRILEAVLQNNEKTAQTTARMVLDGISSANNVQILNSETIKDAVSTHIGDLNQKVQTLLNLFPTDQLQKAQSTESSRLFEWGDNEHKVPENFVLPQTNCSQMWNLWLFGDANGVNTPYRRLSGKSMRSLQRTRLSKIKAVMDAIRSRIGRTYEEIAALDRSVSENLFNQAYLDIFGSLKYHGSMKYSNAYKHLLKMKKNEA